MSHRRKHHHKQGLREVEKLFGRNAALATRLHIVSDLKEEDWRESYRFSEIEIDYIKIRFF